MKSSATIELEYEPEDIESMVNTHIKTKVSEEIKKVSDALIKSEIETQIAARASDFLDKIFSAYRINVGGSHAPELLSMEDYLTRVFVSYLDEKVDSYNRPEYNGKPRLKRLIDTAIDGVYNNAIKKQIEEAAGQIKSQVNARLTNEVVERMKNMLFAGK